MDEQAQYMEPTTAGRIKMVFIAITIAGLLEAAKRWLVPVFIAKVHALPPCEQHVWLANAVQGAFFAVPLLLSAIMLPIAIKWLRYEQFPLPGAWVWHRTKIQRGRVVVARAYLVMFLCGLTCLFPFWARHILGNTNVHPPCASAKQI